MFGIADGNSFYANCQRIYRPDLLNHPVVVLSNNDGCVVALTPEAKKIGLTRGVPYFQVKDLIKSHRVAVFSSNYALYHSVSERMMSIFSEYAPDIEVYSIDEAWLDMSGFNKPNQRYDLACELRSSVLQWIKMPVSVGIAPTKTLAKIANKLSKKKASGVFELVLQPHIDYVLSEFDIADIWGIGRQLQKKLNQHGIYNAQQLRDVDPKWVRKLYNVGLERTVRELQGESCINFETAPLPRTVMVSRMFGKKLYNKHEIGEALCKYSDHAGRKLRKSNLVAKQMTIFISMATKHGERGIGYSTRIQFESATDSTIYFNKFALAALNQIYRPGSYIRAGVLLDHLTLKSETQFNLFSQAETPKHDSIMKLLDGLNKRYGAHTIGLAATGIDRKWKMKQEQLSPYYMTRWSDLPIVR